MTSIPKDAELPVDGRTGRFSQPWRRWLETVNTAINAGGSGAVALAADVAAIATALGSPDGTVANIPDQESLDVVIYGRNGVTVTGKAGMTPVYVELQPVEDDGTGALLAVTLDQYGRVIGSKAATITGTANRITVTNGTAAAGLPTLDIAATYVGQTSLTTLGTISTGTWQGTAIAAAYGGTGQTSYTTGDLLYASGATTLSKLAAGTATYVLTSNGAGAAPSWQAASGGGGSGAMTLVGTATVAGSAATSLTMTGLNLATDGNYLLEYAIDNATGSAANVSLYYNSDTTATNYYRAFATTTTNDGFFCALDANETSTGNARISNDRDGKPRAIISSSRKNPAAVNFFSLTHAWNVASNVTSITLSSSVAASLAVGSTFKIWKIT